MGSDHDRHHRLLGDIREFTAMIESISEQRDQVFNELIADRSNWNRGIVTALAEAMGTTRDHVVTDEAEARRLLPVIVRDAAEKQGSSHTLSGRQAVLNSMPADWGVAQRGVLWRVLNESFAEVRGEHWRDWRNQYFSAWATTQTSGSVIAVLNRIADHAENRLEPVDGQ